MFSTVRNSVLIGLVICAASSGQVPGPSTTFTGFTQVYDGNGGPWLAGHTYLILGFTSVPVGQTLTIQPGAVVKFGASTSHHLGVGGTLIALGTAAAPILFTSYSDDLANGDHNGDGSASQPSPGSWGYVNFGANATACVLDHCEFRWGGIGGEMVNCDAAGVAFSNCFFHHSAGSGLSFQPPATPLFVTNCDFRSCVRPVTGVPPIAITSFTANTASLNSQGDALYVNGSGFNQATIVANMIWSPANTLNGNGVLLVSRNVQVAAGITLTLAPGIIVKWLSTSCGIDSLGTLLANGTAASPVILTSANDDTFGGDSTGNGPSSGTAGAWTGLNFQSSSDASTLTHTRIRFAGQMSLAAVTLVNADITLTNSTIESSSSAGMSIIASAPTISSCAFNQNAGRAIRQIAINQLAGLSGNTASGNGAGDLLAIGGGILTQPFTLSAAGAFNGTGAYLLAAPIAVSSSATLTIDPGVILKCDPASLSDIAIDGTLVCNGTAAAPVVFTSLYDDAIGGDSNGDGASTTPTPGNWIGLFFSPTSDASQLQHVRVRFAGTAASAGVRLSSADITLSNVRIESCAGPALDINGSLPTVTNCAFDSCAGPAPVVRVPIEALANFSGCTAQGNAATNSLRINASSVSTAVTLAQSNSLNADGTFVVDGSLTIDTSGELTVAAGVVLKFSGAFSFLARGSLSCNGTVTQPVVMTSIDDDAFGGNTFGGAPTSGSPGAWRQIVFNIGTSSVLRHTLIRYAGSGGMAACEADVDVLLDHCRIEFAAGPGFRPLGGSLPTVTACAFDSCTVPVENASLAAVSGFSACTAQGNSQGDTMRIDRVGGVGPYQIAPAMALNGSGVFLITANISANVDLQLMPGVVFKFTGPWEMNMGLRLAASGLPTNPVVFTSAADNSYGGNSLGPGASANPAKGDWKGLRFGSGADTTELVDTVVRYAGAGSVAAIVLSDADILMKRVTVRDCLGDAVDIGGNSSPSIVDCNFIDNCGTTFTGMTWAALGRMRDNTSIGGPSGDVLVMDNPFVEGHVTINRYCYPGNHIIVAASPIVEIASAIATNSLSFGPGVVLKAANSSIYMRLNQFSRIFGTGRDPVVFTSVNDDTVGGSSTYSSGSPSPGDWIGVVGHFSTSVPRTPQAEHLVVRWAGASASGIGGVLGAQSAGIQGLFSTMNSCRVEHCVDFGMFLGPGTYSNMVAFANGGTGISAGYVPCSDPNPSNCLTGSTFYHATVTQNGGGGIFSYGPPPNPGGVIPSLVAYACNAWSNGGANYSGAAGTVTRRCNGSTAVPCPPTGTIGCFVYGENNINVDPLFVDANTGNLRLQSGSPCVDLVPPPTSTDGARVRDFFETPRMIPHATGGTAAALSDIGAYESTDFTLAVIGEPRLGTTLSISAVGPAGTGLFVAGFDDGVTLFAPHGYLLAGLPGNVLLLGILPNGVSLPITFPNLPGLDGFPFTIQGWASPDTAPAAGVFTNVYRGTLRG